MKYQDLKSNCCGKPVFVNDIDSYYICSACDNVCETTDYISGSDLAHEAEQEIAKDNTLSALSRY